MHKCLLGSIFCLLMFVVNTQAQTLPVGEAAVASRKQALEQELSLVEKQIEVQNRLLKAKQAESASLARDLDILTFQIDRAKLNIKAKQLAIARLGGDIVKKEEVIETLAERLEREKLSLAELLRKLRDLTTVSLAETVLAAEHFSVALREADTMEFVQEAIHHSFRTVRADKNETEKEKINLEARRAAELDAKRVIEAEEKLIAKKEAEKKALLAVSKGHEKTYAQVLKERERRAAEIRSALFALRDTAAIPFGTALQYANTAFAKTGVRPAFLLAILTQESNLGENVGTCNRPGDPATKGWRQIMKPERDHAPYLRIITALGLDPNSMPLSCPWQNGWGGAMGPAQFIPSTWEGQQAELGRLLGKTTPNPWEPADAFMASALYLRELGAARGGYSAEREAALRYYAGGNWQKPANAFYGNGVMEKARHIQENMINILQNN